MTAVATQAMAPIKWAVRRGGAPLSGAALRCLRYMSDVETHTICYLRDLLVTPPHADPAITTFLTAWNWEERWHGVALDEVLAAHGVPTP